MQFSNQNKVKKICFMGMLAAITAFLGIFATIRVGTVIKIPTKFISVFLCGAIFGPVAAGIVGSVGDILNCLIFPVGPWIPLLTLIEFLNGIVFGLFFYKTKKEKIYLKALLCGVCLFFVDMILTTLVLLFHGYFPSFKIALITRLPAGILKFILQFIVMAILPKFFNLLTKETDFKTFANSFQAVSNPGLERINFLLDLMGRPESNLKFIHIAGTNGKGSVVAFLQEMLTKEGFTVGKFISPNMIKVNERISIDGKDISDEDFDRILKSIEKNCKYITKKTGQIVTQFEIWTAVAFQYFCENGCDYVILETGLGGRLDATNAIKDNVVSVITKVDIDHTEYLGDTIEKIAKEKAGIIKKNSKVVTIHQDCDDVILKTAKINEAQVYFANVPVSAGFNKVYEVYQSDGISATLSLGGIHQLQNAALAVKTAKLLGISNDSIVYGLENARHMGRFELMGDNVIYDGAHNPNGMIALAENLKRYLPDRKFIFVMAAMKDKDISGNLGILKDIAQEFRFVSVKNNPRSEDPNELVKKASSFGITAKAYDSIKEAVDTNKINIVCGSLYLYKDYTEQMY